MGKAAAEGTENTVTLVNDIDGNVGEITISNGAGTLTLNSAGATTTVFSATALPTPIVILSPTEIQQNFGNSLTNLVKTVDIKAEQDAAEAEAQVAEAEAQVAEAKTAGVQASELNLLGLVDNQLLATTDFTVG